MNSRYTKKSWTNDLKSLKSIPKNYISLAKWCNKNNLSLQFAHKVLKRYLEIYFPALGKIKYIIIHGRKICFIEKNTKRNELLISKQHCFQKEFKNFITIKEFCARNKICEAGLRLNFKFLPSETITCYLGKKLILKTAEPDYKKIKLNFLKRNYNQDYITASDFAKFNCISRTRVLQLVKTHKIKNSTKMLGRWYVPKNTKKTNK